MKRWAVLLLFPALLFAGINIERGKRVAERIEKIKRESHRKIKLFLKKETFSEQDINSYLLYVLKSRRAENRDIKVERAWVRIMENSFNLSLVFRMKRPIPMLQLELQPAGTTIISLDFQLEQKEGFYRVKPLRLMIGNYEVPERAIYDFLTIFNIKELPVQSWRKFPYGIKRIKQRRGSVTVYY